MLKKFLLTSAIVSMTSSVAIANPAPYVGAGLGIVTNTSSSVAIDKAGTTILNQPANFRGVPFNLFVGYGGMVSQMVYLAGEVFGTTATGEISSTSGLKTTYNYGASILPGAMLSDHTLAFVRAGVVRTRFSNANVTRTGGQLGLGLQTNVTQNVDIRGEYDFTAYGSFNNSIGRISAPRSDAFNLSLIYKFD